jgi:hypothetical protein
MNLDVPCDQYGGIHDGRKMQVHTIAISEQDSLVGYLEDEIQPAIAPILASMQPGEALVGIRGDFSMIDRGADPLTWRKAGEADAFDVTILPGNNAIGPVYDAMCRAMLSGRAVYTVFGLSAKLPVATPDEATA